MAHDVFVSYSNKDKPIADAVVAGLESKGNRCWIAPRDITPGRSWGEAINEAVEGSRFMVIILSGNSNQSNQVVREVERAVANNVIIIPFRIEKIDPTGAMAYFLSTEHWLDAITPPLEQHIEKLAQTIQVFRNGGEAVFPDRDTSGVSRKPTKFPVKIALAVFGAIIIIGLAVILIPRLINGGPSEGDSALPAEPISESTALTLTPTTLPSPTAQPVFQHLGSWSTSREARNVFAQGDTAYIANGEDGLKIIDVSDPAEPEEVGSYPLENTQNVIVVGDLAYILEQGLVRGGTAEKDRLVMLNVEIPSTPRLLSEYTPEIGYSHQSLSNFTVDDQIAYLALNDSLIAVDVSDPSQPAALGAFTFSSNIASPGVAVSDGIAYLQANRLHVVDFRDPADPVEIGEFDAGWGASIKVIAQKAYIATWDSGLVILDVSDPAKPIKVGDFMELVGDFDLIPAGAASRQTFLDVAISGDIAYLTFSFGLNQGTWTQVLESGVVAIDISNPDQPEKINTYSEFDEVSSVAVSGDLVMVTDNTRGLFVLSAPQ